MQLTNEFNAGHIKEMNNVPLSQLKENYELIPKDKTVHPDIINVKGGILLGMEQLQSEK
jgi:hypothetical protein